MTPNYLKPISNRMPQITVEYDGKNGRSSKTFSDIAQARSFYTAMLKANKNPTLKRAD